MNYINIGNRKIGLKYKPLVIAEIGINHEGDYEKAKMMIKDAYDAGAECVKFQCHEVEDEMSPHAREVVPIHADESIYDIMDRCSLSFEEDLKLKKYAESLGMIYLSTPFSRKAADRLNSMNLEAYKIGSGECNNYPLIEHIAKFGKPVILSTGMNDLQSIQKSVDILRDYNVPFALMHCTSLYPTPYEKVRLGALDDLGESFPDAVLGLSDHSVGNYTCLASVVYGASILEKHFTSDKSWEGPDISISIDPGELQDLIIGSEAVHLSIGGTKSILPEEQTTIDFAYASVVTISDIKKGEVFSEDNLWVKRPGSGEIRAEDYKTLLGKVSKKDLKANTQVMWEDV